MAEGPAGRGSTVNHDPYGCLMCGKPVEYEQFTLLCDECEKAELDYVEEQR